MKTEEKREIGRKIMMEGKRELERMEDNRNL